MNSRQPGRARRHARPEAVMAAVTLAAVGVLGSGCVLPTPESDSGSDTGPDPEPTRAIETPPEGAPAGSLSGVWEGTYTCNQGLTRLRLTLSHTQSDRVSGVLRFSADPSNPSVPSGAYTVAGTVIGDSLRLNGDRWIDRPGVYEMVSLSAELSPATTDQIQGTVDDPRCTTFTVRRN